MKFSALIPLLLARSFNSSIATHQRSLRHKDDSRSRVLTPLAEDCTIVYVELLSDGTTPDVEGEFSCQNGDGFIHRIEFFSDDQKERMLDQLKNGEILSGTSILKAENVGFLSGDNEEVVYLPAGLDSFTIETDKRRHQRRLDGDVFGDKPILLVRVTDGDGLVHPDSTAIMSDNIFGTSGDSVNLKSQLSACSHGQLNIVNSGIIEVTVSTRLAIHDRYTMHNAVTAAVNTQLGITLPGPYEQVMYMMQGCYVSCGYAAYAFVNSWMSVYQGNYYYMTGVQVHELGHNFGLAHSGIEGGGEYTDHTCMMGNPLYSDDVGRMCYNPAKNWALGWYDDKKVTVDITVTNVNEEMDLYGIANYDSTTASTVIIKLETGTNDDYFVGFNRATGANADNDMADDEVTIIKTGSNGDSYSQSWLQAHLVQGESITVGGATVTAVSIDINANPGKAVVRIEKGDPTAPTPSPTLSPTPVPSSEPTPSPTTSPTSSPPTSLSPTSSCSDGDSFFSKFTIAKVKTCSWLASKSATKIDQFCNRRWRYRRVNGVVYGPPNKVCRATCDQSVGSCASCFQHPTSKFYSHTRKSDGKKIFKTCAWLANKKSDGFVGKVRWICGRDSIWAFPKANVICPETCDSCPALHKLYVNVYVLVFQPTASNL